jgi:hypothetical protein
MVLDAKALTWAAKNNIDTAKLKAAKVPIYGKWYFPEMPPGIPLLNLETGEQQVFPERMVAGEVIYVPAADLQRAGLVPAGFAVRDISAEVVGPSRALRTLAPEPLLAVARPPGLAHSRAMLAIDGTQAMDVAAEDTAAVAGIHLPSPSIAPLVLGVGFCILLLGAITSPIILVVGGLWMLAGAIGWIRIGLLEEKAAAAHGEVDVVEVDHGP